jgi:hypothetical protein
MTPTETLLITFGVTVIGSGLGTTIVGAWFKTRLDKQLETHRALLERGGKIHERQVEALSVIYSKLEHALFYLRQVAGAAIKADDQKPSTRRWVTDLEEASETFSRNKLLIGQGLRQNLEKFFNTVLSADVRLNAANDPRIQDPKLRARLLDKARDIATWELPPILEQIETESRKVIHGHS